MCFCLMYSLYRNDKMKQMHYHIINVSTFRGGRDDNCLLCKKREENIYEYIGMNNVHHSLWSTKGSFCDLCITCPFIPWIYLTFTLSYFVSTSRRLSRCTRPQIHFFVSFIVNVLVKSKLNLFKPTVTMTIV